MAVETMELDGEDEQIYYAESIRILQLLMSDKRYKLTPQEMTTLAHTAWKSAERFDFTDVPNLGINMLHWTIQILRDD